MEERVFWKTIKDLLFHNAIGLVDDFNQEELRQSSGFLPFDLLATSCRYDTKHDDSARIVVMPVWSETNLLKYAKSTNWVITMAAW
ncbi:Crinkler (CRN) [Phytophthora megakarya]|uniref:Crinkler (CRN) n=1 Tax=Phytophthora megakarya TaxID=4795 RepID=A0A225UVI2_9STRA|nr:Crinkler (CRN) [Phytophthora megakarya]